MAGRTRRLAVSLAALNPLLAEFRPYENRECTHTARCWRSQRPQNCGGTAQTSDERHLNLVAPNLPVR